MLGRSQRPDLVDEPVVQRLLRGQPAVVREVCRDVRVRLPGALGEQRLVRLAEAAEADG